MTNFKKIYKTITKKAKFEYGDVVYLYEYYYDIIQSPLQEVEEWTFTNLTAEKEVEKDSELYYNLKSLSERLKF